MVSVDQARQDHMLAGIEHFIARRRRLLTGSEDFDDDTVLHDKTATGIKLVGGENGEGIF
jgi:hypothetical protein